ncbi:Dephospho-CoA kinase [Hafnia alvei]|uniref:Dephospho-CoA kinase n=1 Tax=Hafnia alvei TaxID=569 RepID=A0A377PNM2_HAFAL|nr:Dephospho-CoA kinase [Hafnia alvei]
MALPRYKKLPHISVQKILLGDGSLNRALLREIIFNQPQEKRWLNSLLHPMIHQETQRQLATIDAPYALWVVPLLIENGLTQRAQRVLVVDVDPEVQLQRTMARDGVSREQAANILAAQATRSQRLAYADDIIENSGSPETIAPRVGLTASSLSRSGGSDPTGSTTMSDTSTTVLFEHPLNEKMRTWATN